MTTGTAAPHVAARSGNGTRPGLRRCLPDQEPPYDDELAPEDVRTPRPQPPSAAPSTALPTALPTGLSTALPTTADTAPREVGVGLVAPTPASLTHRLQRAHHDQATAAGKRTRDAGHAVDGSDGRFHPVPRPAAAVVTRALLEVVCGLRPAGQLTSWTTPQLQAELVRVSGTVPSRRRYVVKSIRVTEPRPGVAEIVAVVAREGRAAAVALRMESSGGRWRVTRFEMG